MTATQTTARSPLVSLVRAVGWFGLLALGHVGLTAAGETLPTPPAPWHLDEFLAWLNGYDVAQTCFAVLRVLALVTVWYLAAISVLVLIARISGFRPIAFLAHKLALPWARKLINNALGAGLAFTLAGGIVPMAGMGMAGASPLATAVQHADAGTDADRLTMVVIDDVPTMVEVTDGQRAEAFPMSRSLGEALSSVQMVEIETWTISSGDHLWHVAASTLESHWQREPTEAEIAQYWTTLIEHNRDRLAVPGDPDLVYPGQVFHLPPVPDAGT